MFKDIIAFVDLRKAALPQKPDHLIPVANKGLQPVHLPCRFVLLNVFHTSH